MSHGAPFQLGAPLDEQRHGAAGGELRLELFEPHDLWVVVVDGAEQECGEYQRSKDPFGVMPAAVGELGQ